MQIGCKPEFRNKARKTPTILTFFRAVNQLRSSIQYRSPNSFQHSTDQIVIQCTDNGATGLNGPQTSVHIINVIVDQFNIAPVISLPVDEFSYLSFNVDSFDNIISGVSLDDEDNNNNDLLVNITSKNGKIKLSGLLGSIIFDYGSINVYRGKKILLLKGEISDINSLLSSLTYSPNLHYSGVATDEIIITVTDEGNGIENVQNVQGKIGIKVE